MNNLPSDSSENNALLKKLQTQLQARGENFLCAFSGGLDSTVLLHAVAKIPGIQLRAIHIHHGLHADANQWSEHCIQVCRALNIELAIVHVEVKKDEGKGIEAAARGARYQAIAANIQSDEILLTAHHLQDQAETVLLRLLRGSGSQGMASMRALSTAHGFKQLRPLLSVSKTELQSYADAEKLNWIEDPSNSKTDFDRNFLRHEVMPLLEKRWPHAVSNLSRSAELLAEEHQCLREQSAVFLAHTQGIDERVLSASTLLQYSKPWRAQILRTWIESLNAAPLPANILQEIEQNLLTARPDATTQVRWSGTQITRWRDCLYLSDVQANMPSDWQQVWNGIDDLILPNDDRWFFESRDAESKMSMINRHSRVGGNDGSLINQVPQGFMEALQKNFGGNLLISLRQGGENILLKNRAHHSSIKNCLQELGIPPWERLRLPLISTQAGECLAVGDVLLSAQFEAFCDSHNIRFSRRF